MIGQPRQMRITNWVGRLPRIGEFFRSPSGMTYLALSFRRNRRQRALRKSIGVVTMIRIDPAELPAGAVVHGFRWNPRGKR